MLIKQVSTPKKTWYRYERHPFHLVTPSPYPILIALTLFPIIIHIVFWLHELKHYTYGSDAIIVFSVFMFFFTIANWFYDIVIEGTFEGRHTKKVQHGLRVGMILFIISEVMFFFSFFWAFFYFSISPSVAIGCVWPPLGIKTLNQWGIPLLNTVILLSSGVTVTWAHRAISFNIWPSKKHTWMSRFVLAVKTQLAGTNYIETHYYRKSVITALLMTISYGIVFTLLQRYEYIHATFTIADSVYGSTFYVTTGFHGLHVIIGTIFLFVCLLRHINYHFARDHHVGLEVAIWYWHFVDIVWIALYLSIYCWGNYQ
jgi:cytochrome c oxidase subunit 3